MSIIGQWDIIKVVVLKNDVVVRKNDVIDIRELVPVGGQRKARFTCIRGGMAEFSGTVDLDASGSQISGAFEDDGVDYKVNAKTTGTDAISGETWSKKAAAESGGEWDGNRK